MISTEFVVMIPPLAVFVFSFREPVDASFQFVAVFNAEVIHVFQYRQSVITTSYR